MRSVQSRQSIRLSVVVVPAVVITAVILVMIILSVASAVAGGIEETGTTFRSVPDDLEEEDETDGPAPSINTVIVVSGGRPVEEEPPVLSPPGAVLAPPGDIESPLPGTGDSPEAFLAATAMVGLGAVALVLSTGGTR